MNAYSLYHTVLYHVIIYRVVSREFILYYNVWQDLTIKRVWLLLAYD